MSPTSPTVSLLCHNEPTCQFPPNLIKATFSPGTITIRVRKRDYFDKWEALGVPSPLGATGLLLIDKLPTCTLEPPLLSGQIFSKCPRITGTQFTEAD